MTDALTALQSCGQGEAECVVYWTGPIDRPGLVDACIQPPHIAGAGWYEVDSDWIVTLFLQLRKEERTIRAQIHTHPGRGVDHSRTDDEFVVASSPGFVSIVLP